MTRPDFVLNDGRRIGFNISLDDFYPIANLIEVQDSAPNVFQHRMPINGTPFYSKKLCRAVLGACREEDVEWVGQGDSDWDERPNLSPVYCPPRHPVDEHRTYTEFREWQRALLGR